MASIFLSYAREDRPFAEIVSRVLQGRAQRLVGPAH